MNEVKAKEKIGKCAIQKIKRVSTLRDKKFKKLDC
jgi:hypothetical protein